MTVETNVDNVNDVETVSDDAVNTPMDDLYIDENDLIDTFAGLFGGEDDTPGDDTPAEPTDADEPPVEEEEVVEIDLGTFIPVKIGEEELEVTLEELSKSYIREADYNAKVNQLTTKATELIEMERNVLKSLELSKLECDIILEDANKVDMDSLSAEEFKDMALKKARIQKKAADIKASIDKIKPKQDEIHQQQLVTKAQNCLSNLQREVPGFSIDMYNSALTHAVNVLGVDAEFIKTCTDPGIIKALINANDTYVNPARIKKTRMPVKTAKVTPAVTKTKDYSREEDLLSLAEALF